MNQSSFPRTSFRFHSASAILEPQICVVVEQFGAENISLLSGRLDWKLHVQNLRKKVHRCCRLQFYKIYLDFWQGR